MSFPIFDERAAKTYFEQLIIFLSKPAPPTLSTDLTWLHALDYTVQAQLSWIRPVKTYHDIKHFELCHKNFDAVQEGRRIGMLLYECASKVNVMVIDREGGEDLREVIIEKYIPHILHFSSSARMFEDGLNPSVTERRFYEAAKEGWMSAKLAEGEMAAMVKVAGEAKRKSSTGWASGNEFLGCKTGVPVIKKARPWEL